MGLYLTDLCCKNSSKDKLIHALNTFMLNNGLSLYTREIVNSSSGKDNEYEISDEENGWIHILCPVQVSDDLALVLSKELNIIIIRFDVIDGEYWTYQLYDSGELKDKFNPMPDYWKKITTEEKNQWKGSSKILSHILHVPENKLKPYLIFWDDEKLPDDKKAFASDEFSIKDPWGFVDFQKQLDIIFADSRNPKYQKLERLIYQKKARKFLQFFKL